LLRGRRSAVWIAAVMLMRNALGVIITFVSIPSHRAEIIDKAPMIQQVELVVAVLDQIGSAVLVQQYAARHPMLEQLNQRLGERSDTLRRRIVLYIEKRIQYAYPAAARQEQTALRKGEKNFLSVSDLLWLFVIGAFLGDMVETVFCRVTAGVWMSRSSLVWGPFSVVWGLALVLATVLLRQEKDRSDRYLFAFGTVMGGVYEYVCSAVTELLFGTVFWDYSKFKFNLGGRINLLYCFFWGIAAVIWDLIREHHTGPRRGSGRIRGRTHVSTRRCARTSLQIPSCARGGYTCCRNAA
jgi:hypothetical protein